MERDDVDDDETTIGIDDVTLDDGNVRKHSERNLETISASLAEVGTARSIVIDEHGKVLAGNGTVAAARRNGLKRIRVVDTDGETLIAVRRSGLSSREKQRLAIADNRATDLSTWDETKLAESAADGLLADMFDASELESLLADTATTDETLAAATTDSVVPRTRTDNGRRAMTLFFDGDDELKTFTSNAMRLAQSGNDGDVALTDAIARCVADTVATLDGDDDG